MKLHRMLRFAATFATLCWVGASARAATLTVDTTADNNSDDGDLTLREAMLLAGGDMNRCLNAGELSNIAGASFITIVVPIPGFCEFTPGPGVARYSVTDGLGQGLEDTIVFNQNLGNEIDLGSELPALRAGDKIDGSLGSGRMILEGKYTTNAHGIVNQGDGVIGKGATILKLEIRNFDYNGFLSNTPSSCVVKGCIIHGNGLSGIAFYGHDVGNYTVAANLIGGPNVSDRNFIYGNGQHGILMQAAPDETAYPYGSSNVIQNNWVGLDYAGVIGGANPNALNGITLSEVAKSTISGNVVSGNTNDGIQLTGSNARENSVQNNYCGVFPSGVSDAGNGYSGIALLNGAGSNTITGNVASGNGGSGIYIVTNNNIVRANNVGTDAAGGTAVGNTGSGIGVYGGATGNTIGGNAQGNLVSGNAQGLDIANAGTTGNQFLSNLIGTNLAGTAALPNYVGIRIFGGASGNTIGATGTDRNVISGNTADGVASYDADTKTNTIAYNLIGVDVNGAKLANGANGVAINGPSSANTIKNNVISGNAQNGIKITGSGADSNIVRSNQIGVNSAGTAAIANGVDGVRIEGGAKNNAIGALGNANTIAGNTAEGVRLTGAGTSSNTVAGNLIGLKSDNSGTVPNGANGVRIDGGATGNTIGGQILLFPVNFICGNANRGVMISGSGTTGNFVLGNVIGISLGDLDYGNAQGGVRVEAGAQGNVIGDDPPFGNVISGNDGPGIEMSDAGTSYNFAQGNQIGTDTAGTAAVPNARGIRIWLGASNNQIGGPNTGDRNFISGNTLYGIGMFHSGTNGNVVQNNYIGLNIGGTAALGNASYGVLIQETASTNVVRDNRIGGNGSDGVNINGSGTMNNELFGNYIGVNAAGTAAVGNAGNGVAVRTGASANKIGSINGGNVVSGNSNDGIIFDKSSTTGNSVQRSVIGLDVTGFVKIGNGASGVSVLGGASYNLVGGANGAGNVIAGNGTGVFIADAGTVNNTVWGNTIGTNGAGASGLGNVTGVGIYAGAVSTLVGGDPALLEGNTITGNTGAGVDIAGSSGATVAGNKIGTNGISNVAGGNAVGVKIRGGATGNTIGSGSPSWRNLIGGNVGAGVRIEDASTMSNSLYNNYIGLSGTGGAAVANGAGVEIFSPGNTVGGGIAANGNFISGNTGDGILIQGAAASGNKILGNWIGINTSGLAVGNGARGILINGAPGNLVGGSQPLDRNVISGNASDGVDVSGSASDGNRITGNYIGVNIYGLAPLGNGGIGVLVNGAKNTVVGGYSTPPASNAEGNIISGNYLDGVYVAGASGTQIMGNNIGLNHLRDAGVGNASNGVTVALSSSGTIIGGGMPAFGNIISANTVGVRIESGSTGTGLYYNQIGLNSLPGNGATGNTGAGVSIDTATTSLIGDAGGYNPNEIAYNGAAGVEIVSGTGHAIRFNKIHDNGGLGIDLGANGVTANDSLDADTGANNLQNYPVLTAAATTGASVAIQGTLGSVPFTQYALHFYASPSCDGSGHGEGAAYLGSATVTTNGIGTATINATLAVVVAVGQSITATATDPNGNTSEFSSCFVATAGGATPTPSPSPSPSPTSTGASPTVSPTDTPSPTPSPSPFPPSFVIHPASQKVNTGQSVDFNALAQGAPTITYQWRLASFPLGGETAARLGLGVVTTANAGSYDVLATNPGGSTPSFTATLTVFDPAKPNDAAWVGSTVPPSVYPGQTILVGLKMNDTSELSWSAPQGYALKIVSDPSGLFLGAGTVGFGDSTQVVPPGGELVFVAPLLAPPLFGDYSAQVRMVEGYVEFGGTGTVTVHVVAPPNAAEDWGVYE